MKGEEHRTDSEPLLAARISAEPFGVFYGRHVASVLAFFRPRLLVAGRNPRPEAQHGSWGSHT